MTGKSRGKPRKARKEDARRVPGGSGRTLASASAAMGEAARAEAAAAAQRQAPASGKPKPRTRAGKKGLVLYVLPEVTVALRKLALEQDSDVQTLGARALELLFAEHGLKLPKA